MSRDNSGIIYNIQRYCVHDGPGIRTTVFFKGCPLRCVWCHNPESVAPEPELLVYENRCVHCGRCVEICPEQSQQEDAGPIQCRACGRCVEVCPAEARQIAGRKVSVGELVREILRDRIFYDDSGGGATLSGGEPLMQPDFLREVLTECRRKGVHTVLDTCGHAPWEDLEPTAALADLILFDLKAMDPVRHREVTGVSNDVILANLKRLGQTHHEIWIRIPVIPGVNDDTENMRAAAELAASLPSVRQVNLLPYHCTAQGKFKRMDRSHRVSRFQPPAARRMEDLSGHFTAFGIRTKTGG